MPDISYPSIPDPNIDPGAMLNTLTRLKETVELMTGQRKDHRFSFPNQVRIVERRSATANARFTEALQIQANNIQAVVVRTTTLEADMGQAQADIISEQTVRATADTALASNITTLTATVGTVAASVTTEATARANADSALATNITTLNTNIGTVAASVTAEATARSTADSALATDITTVTATANGATASGSVYLTAETAPGGYTAQYGWTLVATGQPFGMKALVDGSGVGSIAFFANRFKLIDPSYLGGAPVNVFDYNGTQFEFNVPVIINTGEIADTAIVASKIDTNAVTTPKINTDAVTNPKILDNAVSNTVATSGSVGSGGTLTTPSLTVRTGARVLVRAAITDVSGTRYSASFLGSYFTRLFDINFDGTVFNYLVCVDSIIDFQFLGGSSYAFYKGVTPATAEFVITGLSAGAHTFGILNTSAFTLGMAVSATELSK